MAIDRPSFAKILATEPFACGKLQVTADGQSVIYLRGDDSLVSRRLTESSEDRPRVELLRTGQTWVLRWRKAEGNQSLETSAALGSNTDWEAAGDAILDTDGYLQSVVDLRGQQRYFRIRRTP
jgi:hypothetical protein